MKKIIGIILLCLSVNPAFSALDVSCSPLQLGSFLLDLGISSATDSGSSRIGFTSFIGQESECIITGDSESAVSVTLNNGSQSFTLSGNSQSFNANARLEDSSDNDLGVYSVFTIPNGSTTKSFKIDATVPSGQSPVSGGEFSSTLVIDVTYN